MKEKLTTVDNNLNEVTVIMLYYHTYIWRVLHWQCQSIPGLRCVWLLCQLVEILAIAVFTCLLQSCQTLILLHSHLSYLTFRVISAENVNFRQIVFDLAEPYLLCSITANVSIAWVTLSYTVLLGQPLWWNTWLTPADTRDMFVESVQGRLYRYVFHFILSDSEGIEVC